MFMLDSVKASKVEETVGANRGQLTTFTSDASEVSEDATDKENEAEVEVENLERPVDLYKVSFFYSPYFTMFWCQRLHMDDIVPPIQLYMH